MVRVRLDWKWVMSEIMLVLLVTVLVASFLTHSGPWWPPLSAQSAESQHYQDFDWLAVRVVAIRNHNHMEPGPGLGMETLQISEQDYTLMGADCSCARRNHPEVPRGKREVGYWFAAAPGLSASHFGNCESEVLPDGTEQLTTFYSAIPAQRFQASPQEVAWHFLRVSELRAQLVPKDQRMEMMNTEAKDKPWEQMGQAHHPTPTHETP